MSALPPLSSVLRQTSRQYADVLEHDDRDPEEFVLEEVQRIRGKELDPEVIDRRTSYRQFYLNAGKQCIKRFDYNWHHEELCGIAEYIEFTPGARVIVTMPPRHSKSETLSTWFPSWCLGRGMAGLGSITRVLTASYGYHLAAKFTERQRDMWRDRTSPLCRTFPEVFLDPLHCGAGDWNLIGQPAHNPSCTAAGLGVGITGLGFDLAIIDDPIKGADAARSSVWRDKCWAWYEEDLLSRLEPDGKVLIILTRWHHDDIVGRLLKSKADDWMLLEMPALENRVRSDDEPGRWNVKHKREIGEALWPKRYNEEHLNKYKDKHPAAFESLYQCNPTPQEGTVYSRSWFTKTWKKLPAFDLIVTAYDTAFLEGERNDFTAWCRAGRIGNEVYLIDFGRVRLPFPLIVRLIQAGCGAPYDEPAVIEDKGSGTDALAHFRSKYDVQGTLEDLLERWPERQPKPPWLDMAVAQEQRMRSLKREPKRPVIAVKAEKDKEARAKSITPFWEAGQIWVPERHPFLEEFIAEHCDFPFAQHDDLLDAEVHAVRYLYGKHRTAERSTMRRRRR